MIFFVGYLWGLGIFNIYVNLIKIKSFDPLEDRYCSVLCKWTLKDLILIRLHLCITWKNQHYVLSTNMSSPALQVNKFYSTRRIGKFNYEGFSNPHPQLHRNSWFLKIICSKYLNKNVLLPTVLADQNFKHRDDSNFFKVLTSLH